MIRYVEGPEIRITGNDGIFVNAEFYHSGEKFEELEPRRLFPKSGGNKYIALLDSEGEQIAIIRDIDDLMPESRKVIEDALEEYYLIPRITRFIKMTDKFRVWMWTAETDHGTLTFEVRNHISTVKPLYDGRVLIKDANDNRYEIPDYRKLDKRSRKLIEPKL
ncbi:MAG: DUF1854 domain-containing protein [Clostridia bacterium]|nr:DUF1854 domain-containing protein [Clostridia bacterium]